jgi:hypothetical protein
MPLPNVTPNDLTDLKDGSCQDVNKKVTSLFQEPVD